MNSCERYGDEQIATIYIHLYSLETQMTATGVKVGIEIVADESPRSFRSITKSFFRHHKET